MIDIVECFKDSIAELRRELEPYDQGWRQYDRQGNDTTANHISEVESEIAEYERIIAIRRTRAFNA